MDFESEALCVTGDVSHALKAEGADASEDGTVRRLMPIECERLQGLPDNHTLVPHNGGPMKDGPRYKIIGNGWALNCVQWIARRIVIEAQAARERAA